MNIIGIIAEYNPFHNGHAYQIDKIRKDLHADYVVIAMSGDFVQRGAPAIIDKYARTQMALSCGADLVIELPALWATASAESFAMAGVTLFDKMGCIDTLCFGAETSQPDLLSKIADILVDEPAVYQQQLEAELKKGLSFPAARSNALLSYFSFTKENISGTDNLGEISAIMNEPNNILAIEYLKAIKRRNSHILPYPILREGAGYHDSIVNSPLSSATAIRNSISSLSDSKLLPTEISSAMPDAAYSILIEALHKNDPIFSNDLTSFLRYLLLTNSAEDFAGYGDSNEFLANRIINYQDQIKSFDSFCELLKTKDMTLTRINRVLLHAILNFKFTDYIAGKELDYIPYFRILGFRKESTTLLSLIKEHATVPLISKLSHASSLLSDDAFALLKQDIFAASIYETMLANKMNRCLRNEFQREIIIL